MQNHRSKRPLQTKSTPTGGQTSLDFEVPPLTMGAVTSPKGHTGLSALKYWGKKPIECLGFLIERLTKENDLVVDPFVGSGLLARECATRQRRFIGIDTNPVSGRIGPPL